MTATSRDGFADNSDTLFKRLYKKTSDCSEVFDFMDETADYR